MKPYYERGGVSLYLGDCREVLPTIERVDHVITDPPYSARTHARLGREGRNDGHSKRGALNFESVSDVDVVSAHFARVAARWVITFGDEFSFPEWMRHCSEAGLELVRHGVWVKSNPMPQMSGDRPGCGFESMAIMHGHRPKGTGRMHWNGGGKCAVFHGDGNNPRGTNERVDHPTQKPVALMLELVELFTDEGETVLDPFAGSGTTGVACLRLGRKFIGIERDEKYAALAAERLEAENSGLTLRHARAGQMSLLGEAK